MSEHSLHKLDATPPDALFAARGLPLEDPALAEAAASMQPADFLYWLIDAGLHVDAVRYLANALPPREGVWWACTSARRALGPEPWPEDVAALEAAEAWVFKPADDSLRRAALQAAQATDLQCAAGLAAIACFFGGGSIAPAGQPAELPPEQLCPTMVASAVLYAGAKGAPERAPERYGLLLEIGMEIASGGSGRKS